MESYTPRVLVVDHEASVADSFVQIFRLSGYQAMAAYSGNDAVAAASTYRPDLALLDVMLPGGLNGIEVAQIIVQENPRCRIILCSGRPETVELVDQANAAGHVVDVIAKPVHPSVVLKIIAESVSDHTLRTNELREEQGLKPSAQ